MKLTQILNGGVVEINRISYEGHHMILWETPQESGFCDSKGKDFTSVSVTTLKAKS